MDIMELLESVHSRVKRGERIDKNEASRLISRIQSSPEYLRDDNSPNRELILEAVTRLYQHIEGIETSERRTVSTASEDNRINFLRDALAKNEMLSSAEREQALDELEHLTSLSDHTTSFGVDVPFAREE